jgi:hypothetical protein
MTLFPLRLYFSSIICSKPGLCAKLCFYFQIESCALMTGLSSLSMVPVMRSFPMQGFQIMAPVFTHGGHNHARFLSTIYRDRPI